MSTFKVSNFTFVEKLPDKKGIFEEIEVTEDVELRHAERTRLEDSICWIIRIRQQSEK